MPNEVSKENWWVTVKDTTITVLQSDTMPSMWRNPGEHLVRVYGGYQSKDAAMSRANKLNDSVLPAFRKAVSV